MARWFAALIVCLVLGAGLSGLSSGAQEPPASETTEPAEVSVPEETRISDENLKARIEAVLSEVDGLGAVEVRVTAGRVVLGGEVANEALGAKAVRLATGLAGDGAVEDAMTRTLDIGDNVRPLVEGVQADWQNFMRALPLFAIAVLVFLFVAYSGHRLASWSKIWRRLAPNPFLAELLAQAVRIAFIVLALVVSLNLLGATALLGTVLGGAGVLGIAIGFAVRDTLENYISSIMLSLRQPFRSNDHVVIEGNEGVVVRLTSRATILMTLDGNHLRIPNSTVFKAIILNYTRNPERRFTFDLGVDAEDDPIAAISTGVDAMKGLVFLLDDPAPMAIIDTVGDSNIVLKFFGWVDQDTADFGKSRSLAIRAAKDALETAGFTLPEPIYRLRFDGPPSSLTGTGATVTTTDEGDIKAPTAREKPKPKPQPEVGLGRPAEYAY